MKAVVTGISGFAGGHLAEHLLAAGDEVLGIVRHDSARVRLPAGLQSLPLANWDISRPVPEAAASAIRRFAPDVIYHLAALSLPDGCGETEPTAECLATNVDGTRRLIDMIADLARPPRLIFVSTSRVYAPVDQSAPRIGEEYALGPLRGYGRSKLLAEEVVNEAIHRQGLEAVVVRAFQHTGPRQDARLMLPEWARQLVRGAVQLEVRHLDAAIDCSDVRDVVRAYRLLAIAGRTATAYNVGSGVARRSGDVVDQLCRLAGRRPRIIEQAPGFKQDPIANVDRLVALTGWRVEIDWEQTLRDTLDDWRDRLAPSVAPDNSLEPTA